MENEAEPKPVSDKLDGNTAAPEAAPADQDQTTTKTIGDTVAKLLEKSVFNCNSCGVYFKTAVFAVIGRGTVCQTCLTANNWQGEELELYRMMLKDLPIVPCLHANRGCKSHVLSDNAEAHMKDCKYRPVKCVAPECPWQNKLVDLAKHFKETHKDDVINDETAVTLDLGLHSFVTVKLLVTKNAEYFFISKRDQGSNDIMYRILNVNDSNAHCADIKHSCRDASETFNVQIDTQKLNVIDTGEPVWKKLNLLVFDAFFVGKKMLSIAVNVDEFSKTENQLRCSGCRQIMRPPIYQCENGHGICSSCRSERNQCNVCQKTCNTRNLRLESLTSSVLYPCTYQKVGCEAKIYIDELNRHEAQCGFKFYYCPLPNCGYNNTYKLFRQHLVDMHSKLCTNQQNYFTFNRATFKSSSVNSSVLINYYIYVDDCCFRLAHSKTTSSAPYNSSTTQFKWSGTVKLLNKDLLKSNYLCEIELHVDSLEGKIHDWKSVLFTNVTTNLSFDFVFHKDEGERFLSVQFTKSNL